MPPKHWKLELLKDYRRIVLFVTTTDRMVQTDLAATSGASLIQTARQYHRRGQTPDQDHRDLAIAAFMAYAAEKPYNLSFEHIEAAQAVPEGEPTGFVSGPDNQPLVPVWEREEGASEY